MTEKYRNLHCVHQKKVPVFVDCISGVSKGRFQIKKEKNGVGLLQPPSVYLPTPFGVQKAIFFMFFACSKKSIFDEKNFFSPW